jgi:predicted dehydrogenase
VLKALAQAGIELGGVVDRSEAALADPRVTAPKHQSVESLFATGPIDLVCITTNGPSHAALAIQAMELGAKRVMVEKPMACSPAECDRMRSAAKQHGVRLAVDHPRRYTEAYRWVRERVLSGSWGRPRAIWIQRPGIGLGCLATHSFDLARYLTGREAHRVTAWVDPPLTKNPRGDQFVDPGGLVILEMQDDLRAVIAQIEDGAGPMSVELDLTAARVRVDEQSGVEVIARDLSVKKGPDKPAAYATETRPMKRDLTAEIALLLAELAGDGTLDSDGEQGTISIELLVAAHVSHREGNRPVALPLSPEQREIWLPVT